MFWVNIFNLVSCHYSSRLRSSSSRSSMRGPFTLFSRLKFFQIGPLFPPVLFRSRSIDVHFKRGIFPRKFTKWFVQPSAIHRKASKWLQLINGFVSYSRWFVCRTCCRALIHHQSITMFRCVASNIKRQQFNDQNAHFFYLRKNHSISVCSRWQRCDRHK